jgi:H+-transporting ATPase
MIEAAVILSAVLKHWPDFFIILVLLLANAGSGSGRSTRRARPSTP